MLRLTLAVVLAYAAGHPGFDLDRTGVVARSLHGFHADVNAQVARMGSLAREIKYDHPIEHIAEVLEEAF